MYHDMEWRLKEVFESYLFDTIVDISTKACLNVATKTSTDLAKTRDFYKINTNSGSLSSA